MCKLPHDYLKSPLKEDIRIIFEVNNHIPVVILRYRIDGQIFENSKRILNVDMLGLIISDAEADLVRAINNR
jgi:hypothetical protein